MASYEDVVLDRHAAKEREILEGAREAHGGESVRPCACHVMPCELDAAARDAIDTADRVEHRGLARAVGTNNREHLARVHLEANATQRRHATEGKMDIGGAQDRTGRRGGGDRGHAYAASASLGADCSRRLRAARLSISPAMRLRCTCAVPPPMVNIRASRTMRSIGRSHE